MCARYRVTAPSTTQTTTRTTQPPTNDNIEGSNKDGLALQKLDGGLATDEVFHLEPF